MSGPFDPDDGDESWMADAYAELEAEDEAYADNFNREEVREEYEEVLQSEVTPPRGPVRVDIDPRIADAVRSGARRMVILPTTGPAKPPR